MASPFMARPCVGPVRRPSPGHDHSRRNTRPQLTLNKQRWKAHKQAMHINDKPRRFKLHTTACYTWVCARTLVHYERLYCNVTLRRVLVKRAVQLSQLLELPSSRGPRLWLQWTAVNPWTHVLSTCTAYCTHH